MVLPHEDSSWKLSLCEHSNIAPILQWGAWEFTSLTWHQTQSVSSADTAEHSRSDQQEQLHNGKRCSVLIQNNFKTKEGPFPDLPNPTTSSKAQLLKGEPPSTAHRVVVPALKLKEHLTARALHLRGAGRSPLLWELPNEVSYFTLSNFTENLIISLSS